MRYMLTFTLGTSDDNNLTEVNQKSGDYISITMNIKINSKRRDYS